MPVTHGVASSSLVQTANTPVKLRFYGLFFYPLSIRLSILDIVNIRRKIKIFRISYVLDLLEPEPYFSQPSSSSSLGSSANVVY
jgi:hypothetical protein